MSRAERATYELQRLFHAFPGGRAGLGLLLLRLTIGMVLAVGGAADLMRRSEPDSAEFLPGVIAIALGVFLIIGLVTPVVSFLATLEAAGMLFAIFPGELPGGLVSKLYCILLAGSSAALVLLGPGAFSVDARWFGWREIIVTPRPPEDSGSESD
jgi:uncharacterized membrane protein YphA (DoxX/SURF4 family)